MSLCIFKVAGRPDDVFMPGCCGRSDGQGASTSTAGASLETSYSEGRVHLGQGCDIVLKGWENTTHVCDVKGVYPLKARKYWCQTHNHSFTHFNTEFAGWLYAQQGPGGCSMWDYVRPEPLVVRHARTSMSADLLSSLVIQYENGAEVYGLVTNMHEMWLAAHRTNASEYTFHTQIAVPAAPCFFEHYLSPTFQRDMLLAQQHLCKGVSTDETFKLSKRCSVWEAKEPASAAQPGQAAASSHAAASGPAQLRKGKYVDAIFCLHTVHSLVTQMVVGLAFLPDKSAGAKEVLFQQLFAAQAAVPDAVITSYVGSDQPHSDVGMLRAVQARVLPHAPPLVAGDDLWHVSDRLMSHRRSVAFGGVRRSLLGVLKRGVQRAEQGVRRRPMFTPSIINPSYRPFKLPGDDVNSDSFQAKRCMPISDAVAAADAAAWRAAAAASAAASAAAAGSAAAGSTAAGDGAAAVDDEAVPVPWSPGGQQPEVPRTSKYGPGFGEQQAWLTAEKW
ncbi:hypothetical protein COO60DRAFT_1592416 [Scenedesmus sp. NREL 46B-D3]|nr:hypothetical protein COO60DRAFT_1592416 [Scenedesmus sp. NREL 46B-D3]